MTKVKDCFDCDKGNYCLDNKMTKEEKRTEKFEMGRDICSCCKKEEYLVNLVRPQGYIQWVCLECNSKLKYTYSELTPRFCPPIFGEEREYQQENQNGRKD